MLQLVELIGDNEMATVVDLIGLDGNDGEGRPQQHRKVHVDVLLLLQYPNSDYKHTSVDSGCGIPWETCLDWWLNSIFFLCGFRPKTAPSLDKYLLVPFQHLVERILECDDCGHHGVASRR